MDLVVLSFTILQTVFIPAALYSLHHYKLGKVMGRRRIIKTHIYLVFQTKELDELDESRLSSFRGDGFAFQSKWNSCIS